MAEGGRGERRVRLRLRPRGRTIQRHRRLCVVCNALSSSSSSRRQSAASSPASFYGAATLTKVYRCPHGSDVSVEVTAAIPSTALLPALAASAFPDTSVENVHMSAVDDYGVEYVFRARLLRPTVAVEEEEEEEEIGTSDDENARVIMEAATKMKKKERKKEARKNDAQAIVLARKYLREALIAIEIRDEDVTYTHVRLTNATTVSGDAAMLRELVLGVAAYRADRLGARRDGWTPREKSAGMRFRPDPIHRTKHVMRVSPPVPSPSSSSSSSSPPLTDVIVSASMWRVLVNGVRQKPTRVDDDESDTVAFEREAAARVESAATPAESYVVEFDDDELSSLVAIADGVLRDHMLMPDLCLRPPGPTTTMRTRAAGKPSNATARTAAALDRRFGISSSSSSAASAGRAPTFAAARRQSSSSSSSQQTFAPAFPTRTTLTGLIMSIAQGKTRIGNDREAFRAAVATALATLIGAATALSAAVLFVKGWAAEGGGGGGGGDTLCLPAATATSRSSSTPSSPSGIVVKTLKRVELARARDAIASWIGPPSQWPTREQLDPRVTRMRFQLVVNTDGGDVLGLAPCDDAAVRMWPCVPLASEVALERNGNKGGFAGRMRRAAKRVAVFEVLIDVQADHVLVKEWPEHMPRMHIMHYSMPGRM